MDISFVNCPNSIPRTGTSGNILSPAFACQVAQSTNTRLSEGTGNADITNDSTVSTRVIDTRFCARSMQMDSDTDDTEMSDNLTYVQ